MQWLNAILANPVLVREMRGRMRGYRAPLILSSYLLLTGLVTLLVYLSITSNASSGDPSQGRMIGKAIFLTVMTAALIQVCLITPSLTAGSIVGEKEHQSYDLLITTLLSPWQIILGKLTSALAFIILLIGAVFPLASLAFLFGGVTGTELGIALIGLLTTAFLCATVGLFWSTVMRGTLGATVMAQGTVILSLLGIPFLWAIILAIFHEAFNNFDNFQHGISWLGLILRYSIFLLICAHPFIALGWTEILLTEDKGPFILRDWNGMISLPSPWLVYTFITLLFAGMFLILSTRLIKPVEYRPKKKRGI